jgi:hypothetical protein
VKLIREKHFGLVRAVNEAGTEILRREAELRLEGFRECLEISCREIGISYGGELIACDLYYIDQGIERDMCCGVWL